MTSVSLLTFALLGIPFERCDTRLDELRLRGSWKPSVVVWAGERWPESEIEKATVRITKDSIAVSGGEFVSFVRYKLRATEGPRTLDLEVFGEKYPGRFEFRKGSLAICWNWPDRGRPKEVPASEVPGLGVWMLLSPAPCPPSFPTFPDYNPTTSFQRTFPGVP